ncbi:hypothetical protein HA466_0076670 [Hirschfeldia incana]|nr:hypothetical protein HA466_0076670 [Hirschfeldia incana]KAJ0258961.1 hypothetical protein HA466_0076670 [Hirschfeldia incana]
MFRASSSDFTGTPPQPRSGHTAVNVGKSMVVVFGGLVDKKFLNDIIVYDTENKLWFEPECTGSVSEGKVGPTPRAFHVAITIDCHMFIFGGRGGGGPIMGNLWALKGLIDEERETPGWTQLKLPGQAASSRCGHTVTSGGHTVTSGGHYV